jgi:hypothetical protein
MKILILGKCLVNGSQIYRGVERDIPSYVDGLPENHPVNIFYWELVEQRDRYFLLADVDDAFKVIKLYGFLDTPQYFDVVEITCDEDAPESKKHEFLGYDIVCDFSVSTLAQGFSTSKFVKSAAFTEKDHNLVPIIQLLEYYFTPLLNQNGLFNRYEDAKYCLKVQMSIQEIRPGLYEDKTCVFQVVGLWKVVDSEITDE